MGDKFLLSDKKKPNIFVELGESTAPVNKKLSKSGKWTKKKSNESDGPNDAGHYRNIRADVIFIPFFVNFWLIQ